MILPAIDGLLLVDKPAAVTSHDVVGAARRALGERRIGHLGTLDPFATGLLVLLVGRATRLAPYIEGEPKVYDAVIAFGTETETDDGTGAPSRSAPAPDEAAVRAAVASLTGVLEQSPPAYSAKQRDGVRAYAAARRGRPLTLPTARVTVHEWQWRDFGDDVLTARIVCGGGTYIRALARDLGRAAGSAAHLRALRRIRSGPFDVADAIPLQQFDGARAALRSPLEGLATLPHQALDAAETDRVGHGLPVPARVTSGDRAVLLDASHALVAIAERSGDAWSPRVVWRND